MSNRPSTYKSRPWGLESNLQMAQQIVDEKGYLPSSRWLRRHGFTNISMAMQRYPDAFRHFPRMYWRKIVYEYHQG